MRARTRRIPNAVACRAGYDPSDQRSIDRLIELRDQIFEMITSSMPEP